MKILPKLCLAAAGFFALQSCSSKKEDLNAPPLADYFPLQVGKYITYRLDSTVLTQFGRDTTVHSYRVVDKVDAQITDSEGRAGFRIFRSITDSAGTAPFTPNTTFEAVAQGTDWIEKVDNNLRFVKLRFPIIENFQWAGNSFIDASSSNSKVPYMLGWQYTYMNVGQPFTVRGRTFENTVTVLQKEEEESPIGPFVPNQYKQWNYSVEVYAKGVGLIYKHFNHKTWQLDPPPAHWEDDSYRLIMEVIDFN
jgi:hypothetical protein